MTFDDWWRNSGGGTCSQKMVAKQAWNAATNENSVNLDYIESYLESAASDEDEAGLLMSAKPLLGDVRNMRSNV